MTSGGGLPYNPCGFVTDIYWLNVRCGFQSEPKSKNFVRKIDNKKVAYRGNGLYYEKEWYSNQKPIKIGWVCAVVYCVLKKGDINLRTRWQNRRGHQSPFSENYVKSTMNYIIINYLYILRYRLGSLGNTPRIQSKASWFEPRWWLYLALVMSYGIPSILNLQLYKNLYFLIF